MDYLRLLGKERVFTKKIFEPRAENLREELSVQSSATTKEGGGIMIYKNRKKTGITIIYKEVNILTREGYRAGRGQMIRSLPGHSKSLDFILSIRKSQGSLRQSSVIHNQPILLT